LQRTARSPPSRPARIGKIAAHGKMGEKPVFLEYEADAAGLCRKVYACSRIEKHSRPGCNAPILRPRRACDHFQDRALASSGAAEERGHARLRTEARRNGEAADAPLDI